MTISLPFPQVVDQSPGDRICSIVRAYNGCSLSSRRDELGALVARGVDSPESVVGIKTNCAVFALGVLWAAGAQHKLLTEPNKIGMAFSWLVQIGNDLNAWRTPQAGELPKPGAAMWYRIAGTNDDHVEFFLSAPDEHGGGGRADNAITVGHGEVHASWSRPMWRWLDPDVLGIPTLSSAPDLPDAAAGSTTQPAA